MSIQKIAEYLFPAGNFAQIRATSPDQRTYNIDATRDLVKNQPAFMAPFAPVAAATLSLPYDFIQASGRARDKFFEANPTYFGIDDYNEVPIGPSFSDLTKAVAAENPLKSLAERTYGATLGLADKMNLTSGKAAPSDAFEYFNKDFFNQNRSGILETDEAQNITKSLPPDAVLNETGVNQGGRGIIDLIRAGGTRLKDTFLQGAGASGGLNIGARLGMTINPALALPAALAGAFFGAKGIREATPGEKGIQSLYGGQNTIGQGTTFIDPITGEEIESEMAGYNISSMFGKGLPSAIQSRIDRINRTLQKKQSDILEQRRDALEKEKAAAEAAELAAKQQAARTAIADAGSGFDDYDSGQAAGMGFGGGRTDPTDKS